MRIPRDYITIPEELLLNRDVSFVAKGLFAYLLILRHPGSQSATWIATSMVENEPSIHLALRELNSAGYIELTDEELASDDPKDKRNPEVTELIEFFEKTMDLKMPRPVFQRRAAHTLIKKHGLTAVKAVVLLAEGYRDNKYAPTILSLEDLRDKWNKLAEYYRKNDHAQSKVNDEIDQMVGGGK
jgi:hypothetical protein